MISSDLIKTLAGRLQTTELNIRREYVQHLFLSHFYQQAPADNVCFKGGTALRLIFGSPRFSEDLDFSTSLSPIKPIENAILDTLQKIETTGINAEIIESKETTGGYLVYLQFSLDSQPVSLELDISQRKKDIQGEVATIAGDLIPPYTVLALVQNQLVTEKITALLTRQKPRDFYDLYFILRKNLLAPAQKNVLPDVLKNLEKTNIDFEAELKQFLPKSHWPIIRDFRLSLQGEIKRNL